MVELMSGHLLTAIQGENGSVELQAWSDGALAVNAAGVIQEVGERSALKKKYQGCVHKHFGEKLILPAFIDLHSHPPQIDIIGSFGFQLLEWLDRYTFPAEKDFAKRQVARDRTNRYIDAQLATGVTTGVWFGTTSAAGTGEMFGVAEKRGVRAIIGKVSMDQNGPSYLLQDVAEDQDEIAELRETWDGRQGRLFLALTPRFAPSCSRALLESLGSLSQAHPELYIQTHVSECLAEVKLARECHPSHAHYTGVYADHGLLSSNTILAHCVHLVPDEIELINDSGAAVAHCPTSNKFLGSGLCPLHEFERKGLATDIGAGTSLCMWETMRAAYGVAQLQGRSVEPLQMLAAATLLPAEALGFKGKLGSLAAGYAADFQVLDWKQIPLLAHRLQRTENKEDILRALMAFGRDGLATEVYCNGRQVLSSASNASAQNASEIPS